jgi:hypothetical protein
MFSIQSWRSQTRSLRGQKGKSSQRGGQEALVTGASRWCPAIVKLPSPTPNARDFTSLMREDDKITADCGRFKLTAATRHLNIGPQMRESSTYPQPRYQAKVTQISGGYAVRSRPNGCPHTGSVGCCLAHGPIVRRRLIRRGSPQC